MNSPRPIITQSIGGDQAAHGLNCLFEEREQGVEIDWFHELMVEVLAFWARAEIAVVGRDRDDDRIFGFRVGAHGLSDLVTIHARQADVQENDMRPKGEGRTDRRVAVSGGRHVETVAPEQYGCGSHQICIVVDDQHAALPFTIR